MEQLTKNFNLSEFVCHCGCGSNYINRDLVDKLQLVRDKMGPMSVTSGVRCEAHNTKIGGSSSSSHIDGVAVDVKCDSGPFRQKILTELTKHFQRIGIAKNFIHVDIDSTKSESVWLY
tara:strand:- start:55 stop:408 length:354 start_codon:yes stop_codon:yes gene_type:complete